jgi:transcriptional regulator with XRE-family HTH domain
MPAKRSATERPDPSLILRRFERRGISLRAAAARLQVDRGHLSRVLNGERPGSRELLESAADLAETMITDTDRRQEDVCRLIAAAVHVFFLKRGDFQNPICGRAWQRKLANNDL